jgi:large subunit ribosomal protein L29
MGKSVTKELRGLSLEDLNAKINEISEDIFKTKMQVTTGNIADKHSIILKRRELARVKTVLNEKLGGNR